MTQDIPNQGCGPDCERAVAKLPTDALRVRVGGRYLLGIQGTNPIVDLIAYGGDKFVGLTPLQRDHNALGWTGWVFADIILNHFYLHLSSKRVFPPHIPILAPSLALCRLPDVGAAPGAVGISLTYNVGHSVSVTNRHYTQLLYVFHRGQVHPDNISEVFDLLIPRECEFDSNFGSGTLIDPPKLFPMCTIPVDPGCSSEWTVMWMEGSDGGVVSRSGKCKMRGS
ncbi:hypothetical protein V8E52_001180 [Russula decolorans]